LEEEEELVGLLMGIGAGLEPKERRLVTASDCCGKAGSMNGGIADRNVKNIQSGEEDGHLSRECAGPPWKELRNVLTTFFFFFGFGK
jgi:hypothetical protein